MAEEEMHLSGGNVSTVVRISNTVRRSTGPWSPAIHDMLQDKDMRKSGLTDPITQSRRLKLFCNAYGLEQPRDILHMLEPRLEAMCTTIIKSAAAGNPSFQKLLAEEHLQHYQREIEALHRYRNLLKQTLRQT